MCDKMVCEKERGAVNVLNDIEFNDEVYSKQNLIWPEFNSNDQRRSVRTCVDICAWLPNHRATNVNISHLGTIHQGKTDSKRCNFALTSGNTFIHSLSHKEYVERYKAYYSPTGLQAQKLYSVNGINSRTHIDANSDNRRTSLSFKSRQTLSSSSIGKIDTATSTDENNTLARSGGKNRPANTNSNNRHRPRPNDNNNDESDADVFHDNMVAPITVDAAAMQRQATHKNNPIKRDAAYYSCLLPPLHMKSVNRDIDDFQIKPVKSFFKGSGLVDEIKTLDILSQITAFHQQQVIESIAITDLPHYFIGYNKALPGVAVKHSLENVWYDSKGCAYVSISNRRRK